MSYWNLGASGAPDYSKAVEAAYLEAKAAEDRCHEVLVAEYPKGARVAVIHHRGSFYGRVVGHQSRGARVLVRNDKSGKVGGWWAAHVQVEY